MKSSLLLVISLLFIQLTLSAAEMSEKKFKGIIKERSKDKIIDELKPYPFFKKFKGYASARLKDGSKSKQDITGSMKYVDGKYIVIETIVTGSNEKAHEVIEWDKKSKKLKQWYVGLNGEMEVLTATNLKNDLKNNEISLINTLNDNRRVLSVITIMGNKLKIKTFVFSNKSNKEQDQEYYEILIEKVD